jgi:hypothetical protein
MGFTKKHPALISLFVLPFLLTVLVAEAAHHHDNGLEGHNDCSICAFQATGSQAPSTPVPPALIQILLLVSLFTFTPTFISSVKSFPSLGRAPPQNLL